MTDLLLTHFKDLIGPDTSKKHSFEAAANPATEAAEPGYGPY